MILCNEMRISLLGMIGVAGFFILVSALRVGESWGAENADAARGGDLDLEWVKMKSIVPRGYVCGRAKGAITVDGKADEKDWADAAWTADFVDIEGSRRPGPRFRTRAKMLWDDENFYIHAELEEPHVWGTITKKNEVIFADNDFEIFIDPDGDN